MKKLFGVLTFISLFVFVSCNTREKELEEISEASIEMDSVLRTNPVLSVEQRVMAEDLIQEYMEFANKYPEDSLAPQFIFKSAMLFHFIPFYDKELNTLELLAERYPESEYAPQALVTAARVSEENVNNIERSIKYLQQIKDKYPESPYATNIDLQIEYAGDDEALLDAIMERNGVDLDSLLEAADSIDAVKK
ncbi:MAG: hypothetical protein KBF42_01880 [Chitinophagales bacterium]|jgi:tetratricopeptide (TPR) repeat protein|nr:hypothetical protein [Bacteroidota bacterium]MBK7568427.1 hypothetical protein [Bacteroidota bacterium]MBP8915984.1 hypothetical protein [Chitinophagales bacterium]MBP9220103.1 hypothetical protein [Chitinophagales bacterium]